MTGDPVLDFVKIMYTGFVGIFLVRVIWPQLRQSARLLWGPSHAVIKKHGGYLAVARELLPSFEPKFRRSDDRSEA